MSKSEDKIMRFYKGMASDLNKTMKGWDGYSDEHRLEIIAELTEGICTHCGVVSNTCHCTNDD